MRETNAQTAAFHSFCRTFRWQCLPSIGNPSYPRVGDTNPPSERDPGTISLMNNSGFPDTLGILGLTSAVFGIAVFRAETILRLLCLILGALCLSIFFRTRVQWPSWVRWLLFLTADSFFAYVAASIVRTATR